MRVLIVRLGALGDIVHAAPVAAALRHERPDARIDWVVDAKHRSMVDLLEGLDTVHVWEGPRLRGPRGLGRVLGSLRAVRYDVALDLQGLIKSAMLARLSGAARVIGFAAASLREPAARWLYSSTVVPRDDGHVIEKNVSLLGALGLAARPAAVLLKRPATPAIDAFLERHAAGERVALLNPGAGWPNKQWPVQRFGELARVLRERFGLRSVVTWGPGERPLAASLVSHAASAAVEGPSTTLADFLELARRAVLVVAGDTGPLHLAAAVGTPVVGLFGPTSAVRNGPFGMPAATQLTRYDGCGCHYARRCLRGAPCIDTIEVQEVMAAIASALNPPAGGAR